MKPRFRSMWYGRTWGKNKAHLAWTAIDETAATIIKRLPPSDKALLSHPSGKSEWIATQDFFIQL